MPGKPFIYSYLIAIGANLGDRPSFLRQAITSICRSAGRSVRIAGVYETAPIGAADQVFLNSALIIESDVEPDALLIQLLAIELELGRVREVHWGNRTIDLDIILIQKNGSSIQYQNQTLEVPHPRLLERDFVLCPCAEIAADWRHPDSLRTLAEECSVRGFHLTPSSSHIL